MASVRCLVRRDTYRDSVELMRVAAQIESAPGVSGAALLMATPANRELLSRAGLLQAEAAGAGSNDLVVAVAADDDQMARVCLEQAVRLLEKRPSSTSEAAERPPPRTIAEAVTELPGANLAIISTPGPYATAEALKALKRGLHVFLFSDNVSIEEEIELKRLGRLKGLLVMGPDCGTVILDGVPIGFANVVRRGRIGLVGASGTGLQQVSCLIDRLGEGVSQVIGVGGHDLTEQVGGLMMLSGIERLAADSDTAVIVLISKPPAEAVARAVLECAGQSGKPVVVNFLGGDPDAVLEVGASPAGTLDEAARLAVSLARGEVAEAEPGEMGAAEERLPEIGRAEPRRFGSKQRRILGLYSGGTLSQEAGLILSQRASAGHTLIDLGADEYTVGRPHPMIDARLRNEKIAAAAEDPTIAVILLDVVLGHGSHPDPAGAALPALERARQAAARASRELVFVASVCGTQNDPQNLSYQETALREAGVILAPSNAQAARLAARIANPAGQVRIPDEGSGPALPKQG